MAPPSQGLEPPANPGRFKQRKAPSVERLSAPVGLREEVLQALDLGALRLHHRFRAGQSRERLVAIARGEQPAQGAPKAAALAARTDEPVKLHRERLERSWCRRTRLTGGHRQVPPMTSSRMLLPSVTNYRYVASSRATEQKCHL